MPTPILSVADFMIGNVQVQTEFATLSSESINWRETTMSRGLHRLNFSFEVVCANDTEYRKLNAFIHQLQGRAGAFYLDLGSDGSWRNPLTTSHKNATLQSPAAIGANVIKINETYQVEAGSYFQLGSDSKMFVVTEYDRTTQTAKVFPAIRKAQNSMANVEFVNPRPLLRLDSDKFDSWSIGGGPLTVKLTAKEVLG